jgi:hypothetical protein
VIEHEHAFRLGRVELECDCGVRQVHEAVHGTEMWHQQRSEYAAERSVWKRLERLSADLDAARAVARRLATDPSFVGRVGALHHPWLLERLDTDPEVQP